MLEDCIERIGMNFSKSEKIMKYMVTAVNVLLLALTVLGVIKSVFVGFDIDEAYAVTQSYRLVKGDHMFSEMWEPHQMSAFALVPFIALYLFITGGKTVGIVLYLRIVGSIIHLLLGFWMYGVARKKFGATLAWMIFFAHANFLPKWITLAEFEVMQYWAVCILFLGLLTWYENAVSEKGRDIWLVLSGAALFVAMMTYPTMVLLYPAYVLFFISVKQMSLKKRIRSILIFTGTTFGIGVIFLISLATYMSPDEFLHYVSCIFMDKSHSEPFATRFLYFQNDWKLFWEEAANSVIWILIDVLIIGLADILYCKFAQKETMGALASQKSRWMYYAVRFGIILGISWLIVLSANHIWGSLFLDKNQFYLYFRFLFVAIFGLLIAFANRKENRKYLLLGLLPGVIGVVASALLTNMSLEITMARMYIAVIATFFIAFEVLKEKANKDSIIKAAAYAFMLLFIVGLVVSKLVLVRVTGCMPVTVRMKMEWVKEGPAAGLLVDDDLAWQYNENIPLIKENVSKGDNLLYFGCENIYYLVTKAGIATPSVQGTTVFNDMFLQYYEDHPERIPNVVMIDKTFGTTEAYHYNQENQIMLDWIEENFTDAQVTETEYLIILRK